MDPLEEKALGARLKYPKQDRSVFRQLLNNEVDKVIVNGKDKSYIHFMGISCSFESSKLIGVSPAESAAVTDLVIFEIGCFVLAQLTLSNESAVDVQKIRTHLSTFSYVASLIFKLKVDQIHDLISLRVKVYGTINALNNSTGEINTLSEFIANSIQLKRPIETDVIAPESYGDGKLFMKDSKDWYKNSDSDFVDKFKWVKIELQEWYQKFQPKIVEIGKRNFTIN